jgi:hypothetical protein
MKSIFEFDRGRWRKLAALLGILIFGAFISVQVCHMHLLGQEDTHCSTCLVVHAPATVIASPVLPVLVAVRAPVSPVEPILCRTIRPSALFIRPPPPIA